MVSRNTKGKSATAALLLGGRRAAHEKALSRNAAGEAAERSSPD
jgi:hypothetical protein